MTRRARLVPSLLIPALLAGCSGARIGSGSRTAGSIV